MATTATLVSAKGGSIRVYDVVMGLADVAGSVAHGLPFTPDFAVFAPGDAGCYTDQLLVTSITATQVNFAKGGAAAATFRLTVGRSYQPHGRTS